MSGPPAEPTQFADGGPGLQPAWGRSLLGSGTPTLEVRGISKHFGPILALRDINLAFQPGVIHGLVGENGAGKSTLGRIIAGAVHPDQGEIRLNGVATVIATPRAALRAGVAAISQEITLVPTLSVIDNVFLGDEDRVRGVLTRGTARQRFRALVRQVGFELDPDTRVRRLGIADQQKVEILRAVAHRAQVLVMDEPTTALVSNEVETLMRAVRDIAARGTSVIYITHALEEILSLTDVVTVMRDGIVIKTAISSRESAETLASAMVGRPLSLIFPPRHEPPPAAPVVCQVEGLGRRGLFQDVSFEVHAGEILGLAGFAGSGCTEVAHTLAGAARADAGRIFLDGAAVTPRSPHQALAHGVSLLPESRREKGLFMARPIRENVTAGRAHLVASGGWVNRRREHSRVGRLLDTFQVRMSSADALVRTLSGGNQQKILLARCVFGEPRLLVAIQPTRGVDVGARASIYELLVNLAQRGLAVVLVSAEMEEIHGLAHRILVLRRGRVVASLSPTTTDHQTLMAHVLGATGNVA